MIKIILFTLATTAFAGSSGGNNKPESEDSTPTATDPKHTTQEPSTEATRAKTDQEILEAELLDMKKKVDNLAEVAKKSADKVEDAEKKVRELELEAAKSSDPERKAAVEKMEKAKDDKAHLKAQADFDKKNLDIDQARFNVYYEKEKAKARKAAEEAAAKAIREEKAAKAAVDSAELAKKAENVLCQTHEDMIRQCLDAKNTAEKAETDASLAKESAKKSADKAESLKAVTNSLEKLFNKK